MIRSEDSRLARATAQEYGIDPDSAAGQSYMSLFDALAIIDEKERSGIDTYFAQTVLDTLRHTLVEIQQGFDETGLPALKHLAELTQVTINRMIEIWGECPSPLTHKFTADPDQCKEVFNWHLQQGELSNV